MITTLKLNIGLILLLLIPFEYLTAQGYRSVEEAQGLKVGTLAPVFKALDQFGKTFTLYDALKKGSVVLIFYRGQWCPICNRHLSNLQDSLEILYEKGATVIAISPEKPELLQKTIEKTKAEFTLLYDEGYTIADAYDVTFKPDAAQRAVYNTLLGADLKKSQSDDSERLPVPATFVIGRDGTILWRHFDTNYKKRSTVADILKSL